jgi:hypothetical protein
MAEPDDRVLTFEERRIDVGGTTRLVLVARPSVQMRLDAERLDRMREGDFASRVDLEILQEVAARGGDVAVVVFDAGGHEPEPAWAFDPDLDDEQRVELGRYLLTSQVQLYRELVRMKATGLVGVGFGSRELAAFQRGTVRIVTDLSEQRESAEPAEAAKFDVDLWLVEHAATWNGLPIDDYLATKLPGEVAERDAKREEIDALLRAL